MHCCSSIILKYYHWKKAFSLEKHAGKITSLSSIILATAKKSLEGRVGEQCQQFPADSTSDGENVWADTEEHLSLSQPRRVFIYYHNATLN